MTLSSSINARPILGWLSLAPLTFALNLAGHRVETAGIALGGSMALAAIFLPRMRAVLSLWVAVILVSLILSLAIHLLNDDFHYRYVWLYSARELSSYLKLTNVWGGEEGTLLFCAALFATTALALNRYGRWAASGQLVFVAFFALAALAWNPFEASTTGALNGRGMNVHLMKVWMTLHPPLIFIAYALVLAPVGAALEALIKGGGAWQEIVHRYARSGWWMLSAGIAFGMWWAFEDFTFGQVWHWDPVQTSVFVVWSFYTAALHGIRRYSADGRFARSLPLISLLGGVSVLSSMAITRNQWLASSHRYIGDTSAPWLVAMAMTLLVFSIAAWSVSLRRSSKKHPRNEPIWMIRVAIMAFTAFATLASIGLAYALINAYLEAPRPDSAKPFFETLARWSSAEELGRLKEAFGSWDVDTFALNRWLAPLVTFSMLAGGHAFLKMRRRMLAWLITLGVAAAAAAISIVLNPLDRFYYGTGVTSQQTVHIFPWLNVLLVCAAYFSVSAISWGIRSFRGTGSNTVYRVCVGCIHGGAVLALIAVVTATVLDSYAQRLFNYPEDFNTHKRLADGYSVTIDLDQASFQADGGRNEPAQAFRAVGSVALQIRRAGEPVETMDGEVLYRNEEVPMTDGPGPVRQLCQVLDYRYARYVSGPGYIVDPFIHRGMWRDTQLWVSPVYATDDFRSEPQFDPVQATVVIRTYPLLSWLWIGLGMILTAALVLTFRAWSGTGPNSGPGSRR